MHDPENKTVDVEDVIQRIKAEVVRKKEQSPLLSDPPADMTIDEILQRIAGEMKPVNNQQAPSCAEEKTEGRVKLPRYVKEPQLTIKSSYSVKDFLAFVDHETFVKNVYRGVLRREADPSGLKHYSNLLQARKSNKVEVLGRIRFSAPGRKARVKVRGLTPLFLANLSYRIPVIGYLIRLSFAILRLPLIITAVRNLEMTAFANHQSACQQQDNLAVAIERHLESTLRTKANITSLERLQIEMAGKAGVAEVARLQNEMAGKAGVAEVARLQNEMAGKADAVDVERLQNEMASRALTDDFERLVNIVEGKADVNAVQSVQQAIEEVCAQLEGYKVSVATLQSRQDLLLKEEKKRSHDLLAQEQLEGLVLEEDHLLDAMYLTFEDKFRGTRQDIKERQRPYLSYVEDCLKTSGESPVLDIGCGRGEWLELLKENDYKARGLDLNRAMVAECQELGLDVIEADALSFLRQQKDNSFSMVTGFHIIEHLDLKKMIALFDEAYRVLRPGGVVIFETPNPENLFVGAFTFYYDPTHRNPLVPETAQFILHQRGFDKVEIKRLNKYSEFFNVDCNDEFKNKYFYSEMDYSVIGYKA